MLSYFIDWLLLFDIDPGAGVGRLTWYDDANGEIGDICNGATAPYYACDGETYLIQLEYSNREQKCVDLPTPPCILSASTLSPSASQTPTNTPTISQFITNNIPYNLIIYHNS